MNYKTCYIVDAQLASIGDRAIRAVQNDRLIKNGIIPIDTTYAVDYVILGGGGVLYEREEHIHHTYQEKPCSLAMYNIYKCLDKGAKFCVIGAGSQGFQCNDTIKQDWHDLLLKAVKISVRDNGSLLEVQNQLSLDGLPNTEVHGDLAFGLYSKDNNYKVDSTNNKNILVSVRTWDEEPQTTTSTIAFLQQLVSMGYNLIWCPHDVRDYNNYRSIWIPNIGGILLGAVHNNELVMDYKLYLSLARQCRASITRRLHGLILGIMTGRPVLSLAGKTQKNAYQIQRLFGDTGYPYVLDNDFDLKQATDLFEQMLKQETILYDQFNSIAERESKEIENHYGNL